MGVRGRPRTSPAGAGSLLPDSFLARVSRCPAPSQMLGGRWQRPQPASEGAAGFWPRGLAEGTGEGAGRSERATRAICAVNKQPQRTRPRAQDLSGPGCFAARFPGGAREAVGLAGATTAGGLGFSASCGPNGPHLPKISAPRAGGARAELGNGDRGASASRCPE